MPEAAPTLTRSVGKTERKCRARVARMALEFEAKGYTYSTERAEWALGFIEGQCRHGKGEWGGQLMLLEEWQREAILFVFGWMNLKGFRVIRTMWVEVARKNGKSQLAAAIGCYLLIADGEPGAEIYSSATTRPQAKIVWDAATDIVDRNDILSKCAKTRQGDIWVDETSSKFVPLSADAATLDGLNPHGNIIDEVHAHKTRQVWDVLDTAMGARRQPLTVVITTAGIYDPEQIGYQQHEYAESLLDEIFEDESWFVWIFSADMVDPKDPGGVVSWDSEAALQQANPNWDSFANVEYLLKQRDKAQKQAGYTNTFKRYHLNQWTASLTCWLNIDQWKSCGGPLPDREYLRTLPCWGGLDLSSKIDLSAVVFAFWDAEESLWYLMPHLFLPGDGIVKKSKEDKVPYDRWAELGYLTLTDGNVIDQAYILDVIMDHNDEFKLEEVGYDPWNCDQAGILMEAAGIDSVPMNQGWRTMSEPCKEFEKLIVSGALRHGSNDVLNWMANNVMVKVDESDNYRPDKKASRRRIDGIVGSIMAIGRGIMSTDTGSDIEDRGGLLILG